MAGEALNAWPIMCVNAHEWEIDNENPGCENKCTVIKSLPSARTYDDQLHAPASARPTATARHQQQRSKPRQAGNDGQIALKPHADKQRFKPARQE